MKLRKLDLCFLLTEIKIIGDKGDNSLSKMILNQQHNIKVFECDGTRYVGTLEENIMKKCKKNKRAYVLSLNKDGKVIKI